MKVCSRSICIWTYFQRFKIQGFPSICEKEIEKKNQFLWNNERNECRQFDMVKFKRLMPRICNIYSRSNVIVQSASFGKTNNSFNRSYWRCIFLLSFSVCTFWQRLALCPFWDLFAFECSLLCFIWFIGVEIVRLDLLLLHIIIKVCWGFMYNSWKLFFDSSEMSKSGINFNKEVENDPIMRFCISLSNVQGQIINVINDWSSLNIQCNYY